MNVKRTENDKYKKVKGSKVALRRYFPGIPFRKYRDCFAITLVNIMTNYIIKGLSFFETLRLRFGALISAISATKASVGGFTAAITQCKNTLESAM